MNLTTKTDKTLHFLYFLYKFFITTARVFQMSYRYMTLDMRVQEWVMTFIN